MSAQGKRVLVIGGETTVGRAIVIGLAEAGADVAIASLTADTKAEFAINSALNELWALGRQGLALVIDASGADQLRTAFERAEADLGPLDAIIAVAGDIDGARFRAAFADHNVLAVAPEADAGAALDHLIQALSS
jgi:NAD(P)-dependent dehydrogenase (short-subunit alcohol dehydrogenase family)